MNERKRYGGNEEYSRDIYSRLFVVCDKKATEQQLMDAFSKYGTIEEIKLPRNNETGELKGVAYVKFSKTSEAACALEALNLTYLDNLFRPLRVMVANNRSDIQSEDKDDKKYRRLFITIPKSMEEDEVNDEFSKFGYVESVTVQRDWNTQEPKGFAYVLYKRFSEAAYAFEESDRKYRAIFAAPKVRNHTATAFESNISTLADTKHDRMNPMMSMTNLMTIRPGNYFRVNFMCSKELTQMDVERLFDIVPGFVGCNYYVDLFYNCVKGTVTYTNPTSAAYAVEKLNGFNYPFGSKIFVKPENSKHVPRHERDKVSNVVSNLKNVIAVASNSSTPDLAQLAEAIAEASKLITAATGVSNQQNIDSNDLNYCSVKLPPPQPLVDIDSQVAKRCFLVCKPQPPPLTVLRDVFCRFGNLINVYTLPNKTIGYARYATVESADAAIKTLHGAELCGLRIKVIEAEEEQPNKRTRYE